MRTKILIIGLTVFFSFTFAQAQRGARIAYIDMEYILESVPEYQEASKQLEQKMQKWKGEIDKMSNEISQMKASLQNEKVLLTKELIEEKEEDISLKEQDLADYQQKRFGPQGDFLLQRQQLIEPIQDQVFNEVQKIGKQKKYDMLIDSSEAALLYSADRHDVSDLVLKAIGRTGKRKEAREKQNARNNPVEDNEPYLSVVEAEEKEKKEQLKEDKKEAIQKVISERDAVRNEQRRVRDSAKAAKAAAYQKRRDKLMADRKRKKDSVLELRAAARAKKQAQIDARNAKKNKKTPPGGE
ncbi:OmpH family outer membrane protein [uncultured Nonlabens sp.]|uniref:OmpH family outer membrane protein n=1 Tax=uncultured Nonlabens sp. TaxID=859306 RepID=UPI0026203B78|nr:OmpH family outer membrane protein [uncultured Nonlabens sp.]